MESRRVLLIGRRASVLTRLAEALRERGIEAEQSRDVSGARLAENAGYQVVAFGRAVREPDRSRIREGFAAANPEVVFVDGYAPIIPLLVAQFEQALDRRPRGRRLLVDASVRDGLVDLELRNACRLEITSYRLDALYRTHERTVFAREVDAGPHTATLDARTARAKQAFVVIRAGDETAALPVG
jgi:hypothetical protein